MDNKIEEKILEEDWNSIHQKNCNVLAAKIWPEIQEYREEGAINFILPLLIKIIASTRSFYSSRMQHSGYLSYLLSFCKTARIRAGKTCMLYSEFLQAVIGNFRLSKKSYEEVFMSLKEIYRTCDVVQIIRKLCIQDKYLFFFLSRSCEDQSFSRYMSLFLLEGENIALP